MNKRPLRILLVAMPNSIHTARWINQVSDQGWDIHLFPSTPVDEVHVEIRNVIYHPDFLSSRQISDSCTVPKAPFVRKVVRFFKRRQLDKNKMMYQYRVSRLRKTIQKINPDIVHSMEFQSGAYLTADAKKGMDKFPPWIATNWGSDIYLFGRLAQHEPKIREVLDLCDYYSCECQRDVALAKAFGFKGQVLPVFPNAGGFDLLQIAQMRLPGPVSERKIIMLKGYQGWSGRALVGLRALERCAELLKGYEIVIHSVVPEVCIAAELFAKSTGVAVRIVAKGTPHEEILRLHGQARISIGLSISDGISTSMLEALVMGSVPIQSCTACADEWIVDGETGFIVRPNDPDEIEAVIRRALSEDKLIDRAAERNIQLAEKRLDHRLLKPQSIEFYKLVAEKEGIVI